MKSFISVILITVFSFLTGCGSSDIGRQYEFIKPNATVKSDIGYLKVYTQSAKEKGYYSDDPEYKVFKGYTIYTSKGDFVKDVKKSYDEPELVPLSAGEYIIVAELHKNVINSFSVKIEKGNILEIDEDMIENPYADLSSTE